MLKVKQKNIKVQEKIERKILDFSKRRHRKGKKKTKER